MISESTKCGEETDILEKAFETVPMYKIKCESCGAEKTVFAFQYDTEKKVNN